MKVLIKKTNQIEEVKDSYALNYLIPQGLAVMVTGKVQADLDKTAKQKQDKKQEIEKNQQNLAQKFDGQTLTFEAKANEEGELFGSISKKQIKKELKISQSFELKPKELIKKIGKYNLELKFGKYKAKIKLEVQAS